jgi:putative two-component system response regulator
MEIPLPARLAALADVYDALVCARVYKPPFSYSEAMRIILEGKETQFDPILADSVIHLQDRFQEIAEQYK